MTALALVIGSLFLSAGLVEVVLRSVGFSRPNFYRVDPFVGAQLRPNLEAYDRREGDGFIETNRWGLRGPEVDVAHGADVFRVAVLGDSFTEALQVDLDETYWRVAERRLRSCAALRGRRPEVLGFGVSGFSTAQAYLMLEHHALRFAPDFVVLQFFAENDVRDSVRSLSERSRRPYFVVKDGNLILDAAFRTTTGYRLRASLLGRSIYAVINEVRLLQLVNASINAWNRPRPPPRPAPNRIIADPIYGSGASAAWNDAWSVTERLIVATSSLARSAGADFLLMSVSTPIQVQPDTSARDKFIARRGIADLFAVERRLTRLSRRRGLRYLGLGPRLAAEVEPNGPYLHGFERSGTLGAGHWNALGHARAGAALAKTLCSALSASRPQLARP